MIYTGFFVGSVPGRCSRLGGLRCVRSLHAVFTLGGLRRVRSLHAIVSGTWAGGFAQLRGGGPRLQQLRGGGYRFTGSTLAGMPWATATQLHRRGASVSCAPGKPIACTWPLCGDRRCRQTSTFGGRLRRPIGLTASCSSLTSTASRFHGHVNERNTGNNYVATHGTSFGMQSVSFLAICVHWCP